MNSILAKVFSRRYASLCAIKKGYTILKKRGMLDQLTYWESVLAKTSIHGVNIPFANGLFGEYSINVELSVRQLLVTEILGVSLKKSILRSIGTNRPLVHPLPKEWRAALLEQNVSLSKAGCCILWILYSFKYLLRGVLYSLKSIALCRQQSNLGEHAFFDRLSNNLNGECVSSCPDAKNIINWYIQWDGRVKSIENICHSVDTNPDFFLGKFRVVKTDGLPYLNVSQLFRYTLFIIYTSIFSFLFFIFKPYSGFLYKEIIKFKRVELSSQHLLAREYLFNNSSLYYRPIWTYLAEKKGSRVLFYFYSSNNTIFTTGKNSPTQNQWFLMSWNHYLVWDKYQINFLKRMGQGRAKVEEVGPIWFLSSEKRVSLDPNAIAVFDVTPMRPTASMAYGLAEEYYSYQVVKSFLDDINIAAGRNNTSVAHKAKRINIFTDKRYKAKLKQLKGEKTYHSVHPSIDIYKVINATKASISLPFTSPSIAAKLLNKPSAYYDPTGRIQKNDIASHGVEVLTSMNELQEWIAGLKDA